MWWCGNASSTTHPFGQKGANPFGLYDMHGNVWEWVADWYSSSYYGSSPPMDPQGPSTGSYRVIRGGGMRYPARYCRSAVRGQAHPDIRDFEHGFRLARSL